METYEATVTLPMAHVMAATAELRGDLRRQLLGEETLVLADWTTLRVTSPVEEFDDEGRVVYRYRGSVQCSSWSEFLHSVSAPA
jgi:hypothetical protein